MASTDAEQANREVVSDPIDDPLKIDDPPKKEAVVSPRDSRDSLGSPLPLTVDAATAFQQTKAVEEDPLDLEASDAKKTGDGLPSLDEQAPEKKAPSKEAQLSLDEP